MQIMFYECGMLGKKYNICLFWILEKNDRLNKYSEMSKNIVLLVNHYLYYLYLGVECIQIVQSGIEVNYAICAKRIMEDLEHLIVHNANHWRKLFLIFSGISPFFLDIYF